MNENPLNTNYAVSDQQYIDSFGKPNRPHNRSYIKLFILVLFLLVFVASITMNVITFINNKKVSCLTSADYTALTGVSSTEFGGNADSFYVLNVDFEPSTSNIAENNNSGDITYKQLESFLAERKQKSFELSITPVNQDESASVLAKQRAEAIYSSLVNIGLDNKRLILNDILKVSDVNLQENEIIDSYVMIDVKPTGQCEY